MKNKYFNKYLIFFWNNFLGVLIYLSFVLSKDEKLMVGIMLAGAFSVALSQSLINNGIPVIMSDFHMTASLAQWLTSAYVLTMGIVAITTPYLIGKYDIRSLFIKCLSIFIVGCIMSYLSPNFFILLLSRILEAIGAGVIFTLTQIVMVYIFTKNSHAKALGYLGLVMGLAPCIGPTLAGYIMDYSGWSNIFLLLVIMCLIVMVFSNKYVYNLNKKYSVEMDFTSVLSLGFSVLLIMLAITSLSYKINIIIPVIIFIFGMFLLSFFVKSQLSVDVPFIKLVLFNNRLFRLSNIMIYIGFFAWMSGSVLIPLFLQSALGVSAMITGYVILPATLVKAIFSPLGSGFYKKFGGWFTSMIGCVLLIISCVPFIFFNVNVDLNYVMLLYVIHMFGVILLLFPMFSYSFKEVDKSHYDQGMSIINSNRQIVAALGTTILLTFVSAISPHGDVSIKGINLAFFLQLILYVFALLISMFLLKPKENQI